MSRHSPALLLILIAAVIAAAVPFAACAASRPADPARWALWLQPAPSRDRDRALPPQIVRTPSAPRDDAWLERWGRSSPSIEWNGVALELVVKYQQNPLRAARMLALLHAAMHDALVLCAKAQCSEAATRIAMHAAAGDVLAHMYPQETGGRLQALALSASAATAAAHDDYRLDDAWRTGRAAAGAAIARALDDGADRLRQIPVRPAERAGLWRAAPPLNIYNPLEANAAYWKTWALESASSIAAAPPVEYGSPGFWKEVEEVRRVASALTPQQKKIAADWDLGLGTVTPGGVWNLHAARLARRRGMDVAQTARVFAALNAAIADAFIACWHAKFTWWTERPVTVIREKLDPDFLPYVVTPAFPSYVSGHATVSGAASTVLAAFFPADRAELARMAEEAAMSRLYAGIHYRSDNEAGLDLGRRVGARVVSKVFAGDY